MFWAASKGRKEAVEFLISSGADIHTKANDRTTVLHRVVRAGKNQMNITPLRIAGERGHTEIVELLCEYGAKE